MPAAQFAALFGTGEVVVSVQLPAVGADASVPAAWNLQGQTVSVALNVSSTVKQLKEALAAQQLGGMPPSKQQLKASTPGLGGCLVCFICGISVYAWLRRVMGALLSHLFVLSFTLLRLFNSVLNAGFLKDASTLAELNLGDGALLELSLKSRGGKR